uniref:Putative secreted protein n=1 Tax=Ixodes ricinus TaxID=34613 RepID=A0A6B0U5C3_IXORI
MLSAAFLASMMVFSHLRLSWSMVFLECGLKQRAFTTSVISIQHSRFCRFVTLSEALARSISFRFQYSVINTSRSFSVQVGALGSRLSIHFSMW